MGIQRTLSVTTQSTKAIALPHLSTRRHLLTKFFIRNGAVGLAVLLAAFAIEQTQATANNTSLPLQTNSGNEAAAVQPSSSGNNATNMNGATMNADQQSTTNIQTSQTNGQTSTSVTVNGQAITVPANGTTQQTITTPGGQTQVSISTSQSGQATDNSFSQTSINSSSSNNVVVRREASP